MREPLDDWAPVAMETVQRCVTPTMGLCTDVALYFRANDLATHEFHHRRWRLRPGGALWFDTYFNGVSLRRWRGTAMLDDLHAVVDFEGRMLVRAHLMRIGAISTVLGEIELSSTTRDARRWTIPRWPEFDDGIVFLSFTALDDGLLHGFRFETSTPRRRDVRLGICITHFDRRPQLRGAVARLKRDLLDDPAFADRVTLVVVDNSRNLETGDAPGATVLPNRNLGGAGGFARGMMHLNDAGGYTHALFMDDDASCEVESIRRTIEMLAWSTDDRIAIVGAMLLENEPFRQFECGARFDGLCHPMRHGVDLRDPGTLAHNERDVDVDYGGWWFFAFPLASAVGYPYPYFVRGDDVDFALRNRFALVTMNGVASWQDDFSFKHQPLTSYLDARNHVLQLVHHFGAGRLRALKLALRLCLHPNLAGQYEHAAAAVMALDDVGRGPAFFREHVDLAAPRRRLQSIATTEKLRPLDAALLRDAEWTHIPEPRLHTLWRHATFNGHLLPQWLFRKRPARFHKTFVIPLRGTFRRRRFIVTHEPTGTGMVLAHSKARFFGNLWALARASARLAWRYPRLAADYRAAYDELSGERFWRAQFDLAAPARAAPTATATATEAADDGDRVESQRRSKRVAHAA